jgi:hypothetical protein
LFADARLLTVEASYENKNHQLLAGDCVLVFISRSWSGCITFMERHQPEESNRRFHRARNKARLADFVKTEERIATFDNDGTL